MSSHTHDHEAPGTVAPSSIIDNLVRRTEANELQWRKGDYQQDFSTTYQHCTIRVHRMGFAWKVTITGSDRRKVPAPITRRDCKRLGQLVERRYKAGELPQHAAILRQLAS